MKPASIVFIAAALGLGLAACSEERRDSSARADAAGPSPPARYADDNRDGRVTREEARADAALSASFDRYDLNDNGELDRAEFARLEARAREREEPTKDDERHPLRPRREFPRPLD